MARHVFVLLLVAVCLLQMSRGRPLTTEEAYHVLSVERRFLLLAVDLLGRWRRSRADHPQLVEEMRHLKAHHDQLLAALEARPQWTSEAQLQTSQRDVTTEQPPLAIGTQLDWTNKGQSGITSEVTEALLDQYLPHKLDHSPRKGGGNQETQNLFTVGWFSRTNDVLDETTGVGASAEVVDLLRLEAPSAEDLHQLADEFKRIWELHKLRFAEFDADKDISDEQ